jgi:type VI protein secretion system component VasK
LRIWRGRHAEPFVIIWVIAIVLAAALYEIQNIQPAFSELLRPVYLLILLVALLVTWKWFRTRASGRQHDRRHGDRRHSDRRDEFEDDPPS